MLIKFLEDLRFVIGAFFALIGIILVTIGYVDPASIVVGQNMNLISGWTMIAFSLFMFGLVSLNPDVEK
ncbi:MAG: hypothetical protein HQK54_07920 [Oligoflexales bacterium]|nr:hypothetical protein [Oligoflexales bacterium]